MRPRYEYCLCMVQTDRVTFVNHEWIGTKPMDPADSGASLESCPRVWDWLNAAGQEGWELVSTLLVNAELKGVTLYMRRVKE